MRLEEFVRLAEPNIPGVRGVIEVFRLTGNWKETAAAFSQRWCAAIRWCARQEGKRLGKKLRQNLGKESGQLELKNGVAEA